MTDCPFSPMPEVFREIVDGRKHRSKGSTTVTDLSLIGGAYTVIFGPNSDVRNAAIEEAASAIHRRLVFLRDIGRLE